MSNQYCPIKSRYPTKRRKFKQKTYYGVSETAFKLTYANHKKPFNNVKYQSDTELSIEFGI